MTAAVLAMLPRRRGVTSVVGGHQWMRLIPRHYKGRSFIYAIAFAGNVLKVGMTTKPRERLRSYLKTAGSDAQWFHLFAPMHRMTARSVELRAPQALNAIASCHNKSEWFITNGADKATVVRLLRSVIDVSRADVQLKLDAQYEGAVIHHKAASLLVANGIDAKRVLAGWYSPSKVREAA